MEYARNKRMLRIGLVSLYALLVMRLIGYVMPISVTLNFTIPQYIFLFFYVLVFNLNTEGSLFIDRYLNKKYPWFQYPKKRLIIQITTIILWTIFSIGLPFLVWYYINDQSFIYKQAPVIIFTASIIFLLGFLGISMAINFFKQWKESLLAMEQYRQEKLKAEYRVLQNQINPHFLFNSLNVLLSEIKHDPEIASNFTRKLSRVYRYVLQSKNYDLITVSEELKFMDSFIYLHRVRIGDSLHYTTDISEEVKHFKIPPLTLQILMENAIKHNVVNEEHNLYITIKSEGNRYLIVRNNRKEKTNVDSTYTGLSNLKKRFELLATKGFSYEIENKEFVVYIPLIKV